MGTLDGKVALVTGAGRGIGRSVALRLAAEGARVVANDVDEEPNAAVVREITDAGGRAVSCPGSVTDDGFAERFVHTAVEELGGLDIIVNNAGHIRDNVIQKMTDEQWDDILSVHLTAPFRILRAAQPVIAGLVKAARAAGHPVPCRKIVNISSVSGVGGNAGQANYAAAKAGVIGLTKSLAREWGRYNTTVNAVAFGLIATRATDPSSGAGTRVDLLETIEAAIPLGRPGTPREAAGAVHLLCTADSDYITAQTLVCDGGFLA